MGTATSMAETANSIAFLEGLCDLASDLFYNTAKVTTHLKEASISSYSIERHPIITPREKKMKRTELTREDDLL